MFNSISSSDVHSDRVVCVMDAMLTDTGMLLSLRLLLRLLRGR